MENKTCNSTLAHLVTSLTVSSWYRKPPACGICNDSPCEISAAKSQARCLCYPKYINHTPLLATATKTPCLHLEITDFRQRQVTWKK